MNTSDHARDLMFDVNGFCGTHKISRTLFYKLLKIGRGPRLTKIGRRTFVTGEAAAEWRARMEAETKRG